MRNDQMWPLHLSWVSWLQNEAQERKLPLAGVNLDADRWSRTSLDDARGGADRATVGQRLGCGRIHTHLMFWRGETRIGAWLLECVESEDQSTARAWQVLLLETLVLSTRHEDQEDSVGMAAK